MGEGKRQLALPFKPACSVCGAWPSIRVDVLPVGWMGSARLYWACRRCEGSVLFLLEGAGVQRVTVVPKVRR